MTYRYITIAHTEYGELGHNGQCWVLNHPFCVDDKEHPAYYEEFGLLTNAPTADTNDQRKYREPQVMFDRIFDTTRGGVAPRPRIYIPVTVEQIESAHANRHAFDAMHRPAEGYRIVVD